MMKKMMKKITKKYLKDYPMADLDCLSLGKKHGKTWWISYARMEDDVMYYNFGYEDTCPKNEDDISFESLDIGLVPLYDFIDLIRDYKEYIKNFKEA